MVATEPHADILSIRCRHCGVEPGEKCTTKQGKPVRVHSLRVADARAGISPGRGEHLGAQIIDFAAERTRRLAAKNGFTGGIE